MTWLEEAKKTLETARLSGQASHSSIYAVYVSKIIIDICPRALELLTEAEGFIEDCICGTDQDDDERVAFLRKLRGEEAPDAQDEKV